MFPAITRALTLLYTISLLNILTRIQLNLLGRRTYLSSVVSLANPQANTQSSTISLENRDDDNMENFYGNDFETNRKYLTFSWWLLHRGSKHMMERVMVAVKDVFGAVNIREDISMERLSDLIMQVRKQIEGSTDEERRQMRWLPYLLPPQEEEQFVIRQAGMSDSDESPSHDAAQDPMSSEMEITHALRKLLDETSDLIDSPTFSFVLTRLLDSGFSNLIDHRVGMEAFKTGGLARDNAPRVTEILDVKCKIAHILPVFCRQAHSMLGTAELETLAGIAPQESMGNEYLAAMEQVPDLEAFAAVIYSSNIEYELAEDDNAPVNAPKVQPAEPEQPSFVESGIIVHPEPVDPAKSAEAPLPETTNVAVQDDEPQPQTTGAQGFESAWKKALANEDGVKTTGSDDA